MAFIDAEPAGCRQVVVRVEGTWEVFEVKEGFTRRVREKVAKSNGGGNRRCDEEGGGYMGARAGDGGDIMPNGNMVRVRLERRKDITSLPATSG